MAQKHGVQYIYLEMKAGSFMPSGRGPIFLFALFSLILSAIMILVIFLYGKNEKYKDLHERQMQLVQLGEASRTIAHEIKNPLSSIKIQTALLRYSINKEGLREINIIDEEVDRIKNISDKVRDFLGDPAGNPQMIDLDEFIKGLIGRYGGNIIYENLSPDNISICIDPERMRSILENILNNAVESTEEIKQVKILMKSEKNDVVISVIDEGKGINKNDLKSIFDPFFTTKIHGLGLGLSLVKKYIEAAGGKIEIVSGDAGTAVDLHFKTGGL
jgi:two-component system sensor histidine kinase HydH